MRRVVRSLPKHHLAVGIEPDKDEEHCRKGHQRCAAITDKGQRDPDHRRQADGHTDVDRDMEEQHARDAIGITPAEDASLSLRDRHDPHEEYDVDPKEQDAAEEAEAFADGAEDEVRLLLGHEIVSGLGALQEPLADQAAATDGDLALFDVVIIVAAFLPPAAASLFVIQRRGGCLVFGDIVLADGVVDAFDLVGFEYMMKRPGYHEPLNAHAHRPDTDDPQQHRAAAADQLA